MNARTITLALAEPDSMRLLHAALQARVELHANLAASADRTALAELGRKRAGEAKRNERRAAEYRRRQQLLQQLLDQLPSIIQLTAPTGT